MLDTSVFVLRRVVLITLLVLPQWFWLGRGWRLAVHLPGSMWRRAARGFLLLVALAVATVLVDRISHKSLPASVSLVIAPVIQLWVFTSTFAFFCVMAVKTAGWLWRSVPRPAKRAHSASPIAGRRDFFRYAAALVGTVPFMAAVYGFAERLRFQIVRVDVPIPNLPAALNGFRIAQISDIHIGDFMPPQELRRAIDLANGLGAHMAVVTGDFVSGQGDPLADCIDEISRLRAPLGVWGCNGNHEIYADAEDAAETLFQSHGMKLLRQAAAQLSWNGAEFNLIGIDYQREIALSDAKMPTLSGVENLVRGDMPNILLSHNPNAFYRAAALGIELTISGHTHGGQINVEIVHHGLNPARFMTQFIAGLYRLPMQLNGGAPASLYVNRGLGTLGVPCRLGAAPEITLLTLRPA